MKLLPPALLLLLFLCTCGPAPEKNLPEEATLTYTPPDAQEATVHLTTQQIQNMDIRFGDFTELKLNDYLSATGVLGLPPNAYAAVSTRAAGFVHDVRNYVEGDYVQRGAVLGYLENVDFIDQQQRLLEVRAELQFARQELERQETLLAADAGILRAVQRLRAEVAAKEATLAGITQRLEYVGIPARDVTPENIVDRVTLFAPRSGFITMINVHDGMYVEPSTELMELIDEAHLHLELEVYERDVGKVRTGQRVSYRIPALGDQQYEAEVHVIGKEFNAENKTVRVHAHLRGEQPPFVEGRFAEARIWLDDQTVRALPEAAIVREGETSYVYAGMAEPEGEEVTFERLLVNPGTTDEGFTAVRLIDSLPADMRIVTQGAYFVYAQSRVGEMGHEH